MLEPKSLQESILKHQQALLNSSSSAQIQSTNTSPSFIPNMFNSTISNEDFKKLHSLYYSYNQHQQPQNFNELNSKTFLNHNICLTEKTDKKRKFEDDVEDYKNELTSTKHLETSPTNKKKKSSFLISDILDLESSHMNKKFCVENEEEVDVDQETDCASQDEKSYRDKLNMEMFQTQLHRYVSSLPIDFYRFFTSLVNQTGLNSNHLYNQNTLSYPMMDYSLKIKNNLGPLTHSTFNSVNQGGCSNKPVKYEEISLCSSSGSSSSSTFSSSSLMPDEEGKSIQQETSSNRKSNSNITQSTPSTQSILSSLELLAKKQFTDKQNFASTGRPVKNSVEFSEEHGINSSSKKQLQISSETENKQKFISVHKQSSENNQNIKNDSNSNNNNSKNSSLPAWIFCTRYSDRPSAGPRQRKRAKKSSKVKDKHRRLSSNSKSDEEQSSPFINAIISIINDDKPATAKKSKSNNLPISTNNSSSSSNTNGANNSTEKIDDLKNHSNFDLENEEENSRSKTSEPHQLQQQQQQQQRTHSNISSSLNYDDEESNLVDSDDENNNEDEDDDENDSLHSKRARTAFTSAQLNRLKHEFERCKYLTGEKRQYLANELNLNESQIKIWFQNKRAKIKKSSGVRNSLAMQLMAQGLYNHGSNRSNALDTQ